MKQCADQIEGHLSKSNWSIPVPSFNKDLNPNMSLDLKQPRVCFSEIALLSRLIQCAEINTPSLLHIDLINQMLCINMDRASPLNSLCVFLPISLILLPTRSRSWSRDRKESCRSLFMPPTWRSTSRPICRKRMASRFAAHMCSSEPHRTEGLSTLAKL